jgi:Zn-dependent M28 family amino/carboxypeptidase
MAMAQKTEVGAKYAELITQQGLKEKLTIVASAEMEGRETASPGQKRAAAYIESQFKKFGLKPGNGDSYQQLFPVYQDVLSEKSLSVNGKSFMWDQDYSFSMQTISTGNWQYNNVVFVGYGTVDSAKNINDYEGLDVKGKLVMIVSAPASAPTPGGGRGFGGPSMVVMNAARKNGAAGILLVTTDFPKKNPTAIKGRMSITAPATTSAPASSFVIVSVSENVATALLGRSEKLTAAQLKDIPKGLYISDLKIAATKNTETLESSNVIGILPGTDKKEEYVFLTGHYDHLGKVGDVIWYGADDDGSGTVTVLQMAEAFGAAAKKGNKPRRTIVFMTVSGEEKGLLGSQYYSEHPIYSLDKTSVDLNTDMVGRVDTERKTADTLNYVYVIGHDKLSSDLPIINEGINNKYTKLVLDYKYDDPNDRNRIYYRSDHYNFARKGVPILFFYDGMLLADYHQPTDTVEKINFELMEKRAKMIFLTGWEIANRDEMLKRDKVLNMPGR